MKAIRVDTEEAPFLMADYKRNIVDDLYLSVIEFQGENYIEIRMYCVDRDGNLKAKNTGIAMTLGQFAIFIDSMENIESRFWEMEEGVSINPYDHFIGPWKITVNVFGYINISKYYYDSATDQLVPSNKWISFSLNTYRPLAREIFNLIEHYPNLKDLRPCYDI